MVKFSSERKAGDILAIPFFSEKKGAVCAADCGSFEKSFQSPIKLKDFKGDNGETLILYDGTKTEKRVCLLGLGNKKELNVENLRRAYASLTKKCIQLKLKSVNIFLPKINEKWLVSGIAEGILLSNYSFDELKEEKTSLLDKVALIGADLKDAKQTVKIFEGVYLTRNLVNGNADDITPQYFSKLAQQLARKYPKFKTQVFNKKKLQQLKMGLILAVNQGSNKDPAMIIMSYQGAPKTKDHTVLVGKGITYDTGGLNLKPTGSIETMKCDMGGAATVFGIMKAAAELGLKKNITGVVATTENAIGPQSYKPGDVFKSYSGKTVEIGNTDAEGRLVLADALSYTSKKLNPTRIIDFATLTGAILIALGDEVTGMMSNDDKLSQKLSTAGENTYERVWRMPIYKEYRELIKSDIADIKNIGGRLGGSITAAIFLQEFIGNIPWAHCDIAGTAYLSKEKRYNPKNGTGVGVRLIIDFLKAL